ncbi:MAG: glycosyltransferase family 1 protein, partial [Chitinophagaceae bacterium]
TKKDIIEFYKIPEKKISICYQSCHPAFGIDVSEAEKSKVRKTYHLPDEFFLYVGSIIERKNLLNICKAFFLTRNEITIPLVVVGDGGRYKKIVKDYILQQGLEKKIIFLSETNEAKTNPGFQTPEVFAAIYQSAIAMIYPSFFEGFGSPVMEALWSRLPVITSNVSCLPEVGGPGAYYVNPDFAEEIAEGIKKIYFNKAFADTMRDKGLQHAHNFAPDKYAASVMDVYKSVW